ncbi:hypothetical protein E2562_025852 [Oryza meyeriana var. granulata]|uniref:Uncharacterized protein n=1 Tax=Oryza meyeriana var. granulata TaxID=110450 RepID=A0A6G1E2L3_9ORYZ|nr:hypothetical protein E2562_025852 [Oryza meyeriana var. granulata]
MLEAFPQIKYEGLVLLFTIFTMDSEASPKKCMHSTVTPGNSSHDSNSVKVKYEVQNIMNTMYQEVFNVIQPVIGKHLAKMTQSANKGDKKMECQPVNSDERQFNFADTAELLKVTLIFVKNMKFYESSTPTIAVN